MLQTRAAGPGPSRHLSLERDDALPPPSPVFPPDGNGHYGAMSGGWGPPERTSWASQQEGDMQPPRRAFATQLPNHSSPALGQLDHGPPLTADDLDFDRLRVADGAGPVASGSGPPRRWSPDEGAPPAQRQSSSSASSVERGQGQWHSAQTSRPQSELGAEDGAYSGYATPEAEAHFYAQQQQHPPAHSGSMGGHYRADSAGTMQPPPREFYGPAPGSDGYSDHYGQAPPQGYGGYAQAYGQPYPPQMYGSQEGAYYGPPGGPQYGYAQPQPGLDRAPSSMSHYQQPIGRTSSTLSAGGAPSGSSVAAGKRRATDGRQAISKAAIDEYRNRIKNDPDPELHFNYAKYLIEAARKLATQREGTADYLRSVKKYRDALLQESLKIIKRLATQGTGLGKPAFAEAQFFLANCLSSGAIGLSVDHEKAYNLYVQASKQNHAAATYRTAICNERGAGTRRDPARAVLFFRKASALGETAGMYRLGMILLNGELGQPRDGRNAVLWLKRAAQQADEDAPHALHELAMLYERPPDASRPPGPTVPQDHPQALELFTQSAKLGYAPSQHRLGAAFEYGTLGCPIDPRRSIAWYTRAAERNHGESELALSGWFLTGSEGVLKQDDTEAYLWARRAANKGLARAEFAVGYYSDVGIGVARDVDEARKWYLRAASQGNKRAMQRLTELKKQNAARPGKKVSRQEAKDADCVVS